MWSWVFVDTITGDQLLEVVPSGGSAERLMNADSSGSNTFRLAGSGIPRETWWGLTTPWARTLVQCWDGAPVTAGVITGRPYDRASKTLTVEHRAVRSVFKRRYPFGVSSYWADEPARKPGRLVITNRSLVSATAIVLRESMLGPPGGANYSLPIVLPSTSQVGPYSAVIENYNFRTASDLMSEFQETDGGPDTDFAPRWSSAGKLEWVARIGDLSGNVIEWQLDALQAPTAQERFEEDAVGQATGVFGIGQGSGEDMVVGGTPRVAVAGIPAQDVTVSWKHVTSDGWASAMAKEHLRTLTYATRTPTLTVKASVVDPRTLIPGSLIRLHDSDDPWLPDGWSQYRLLGFSVGVGDDVSLTIGGV